MMGSKTKNELYDLKEKMLEMQRTIEYHKEKIVSVRKDIARLKNENDHLKDLINTFFEPTNIPTRPCHNCQGQRGTDCSLCRGYGYVLPVWERFPVRPIPNPVPSPAPLDDWTPTYPPVSPFSPVDRPYYPYEVWCDTGTINLSESDFKKVMDTLENPPEPNDALKNAFKKCGIQEMGVSEDE